MYDEIRAADRRRRHRRRCAARLFAALVAAAALPWGFAAPASAADVVTVLGPTTRALGTQAVYTFPLELPAAAPGAPVVTRITAAVSAVTRAGQQVPTSSLAAEVDIATSTLTVSVKEPGDVAAAGDYTVALLLDDLIGHRQGLTLTFSRAAATLLDQGTVEARQVEPVWALGRHGEDDRDVLPPLELGIGPGAPLRELSARQKESGQGTIRLWVGCDEDDDHPECRSSLSSRAPVTLDAEANGVLRIDYAAEDFPFGTTTRTVELRSSQLAAPVTITFSVTRIRSALWIPIICAVGLVLGLLVRKLLGWLIARGRLSRLRKELLTQSAGVRLHYDDAALRTAVEDVETKTAGASEAELATLRADVAAALKAANDRITALVAKRDAWAADVVGKQWLLPTPAADTLQQVGALLGQLSTALAGRRTDVATEKAADLALRTGDLGRQCADFRDGYLTAVARAKTAIAGASGADVALFATALDKVAPLAADPWPTDLHDQLQLTHGLVHDWQNDVLPRLVEVVDGRADRAPDEAERIRAVLASGGPAQQLSGAADHLAQLIATAAAAPPAAVAAAAGQAPEPAQAPATEVSLPSYPLPVLEELRLSVFGGFSIAVGWLASLATTVVLAVVVAGLAWAVAQDDWTGTPAQFVSVFAWAFATDLTVQAVRTALGTTSPTPPTFA